ncbi:MAG: hypothetical protein ACRDOO_19655 [Actinomadura sp.]
MSGRTQLRTMTGRMLVVAASITLATSGVALPATAVAAPRDCYGLGYDEGVAKGRSSGYDAGYKDGRNYTEANTPPASVNRRPRPAVPAQPPQCVGDARYDQGYDAGHKNGYDAGYGTGFVAGYNSATEKQVHRD